MIDNDNNKNCVRKSLIIHWYKIGKLLANN